MLKLSEIISFLGCKTNKNIATFSLYPLSKKKALLLVPENTADRVFTVHKTKIPTEYRKKYIKCFKN